MDFTGAKYEGDMKDGCFHGNGLLTFPNGNRYEGQFKNGLFHGRGTMHIAGGGSFTATFVEGKQEGGGYEFDDKLKYKEKHWKYCTAMDRRFQSEIVNGIPPAGSTKMSDKRERSELPEGTYDCVDGYFDPKTGKVLSYETKKVIRTPDDAEVLWIKAHCRIGHPDWNT